MMIEITQLQTEATKLISERFQVFAEIDSCKSIYEWPKLQAKLSNLNMKIDQYEKSINALKGIKRRMMR